MIAATTQKPQRRYPYFARTILSLLPYGRVVDGLALKRLCCHRDWASALRGHEGYGNGLEVCLGRSLPSACADLRGRRVVRVRPNAGTTRAAAADRPHSCRDGIVLVRRSTRRSHGGVPGGAYALDRAARSAPHGRYRR